MVELQRLTRANVLQRKKTQDNRLNTLLRPSHLFLSLSRRYEEWSWIRLVQDSVCPYMGAPRSFVCLQNGFRIEFSQPHRLTGVFVTHLHTHTHISYLHTDQHKSWYTSKQPNWLCFILFFSSLSILNCPFFPRFSLSCYIFSNLPTPTPHSHLVYGSALHPLALCFLPQPFFCSVP